MIVLCGGCRYDFTPRWLKWGSSFVKAALMRPDLASIKSWEKIKGGRWMIKWSLWWRGTEPLWTLSPCHFKFAPATSEHEPLTGGWGQGQNQYHPKRGGLGGNSYSCCRDARGEQRRKYHYQVGAHLVTTEAYILNCTLHLSLKKYLRGILDLLLCSAVETNEASKRWQVYLLFFASRSKARHKFTTTDIRSVVNRKS